MELNTILQGDCLQVLKTLPSESVDCVVTDPPYELGFMGKSWDNTGIANNVDMWKECLRVLKSGGHLLSFGGTRTYHRMASAIEDAGFEVRDMIEWVYGSGFPKSTNIAIRIDKEKGLMKDRGVRTSFARKDMGDGNILENGKAMPNHIGISPEAKQWEGWGTALKPAHEPICMARKPIEKTVAENCLKWGTGGINIDESRVGTESENDLKELNRGNKRPKGNGYSENTSFKIQCEDRGEKTASGRFPANIIHDNSEEVRECFPETKSGGTPKIRSNRFNAVPYNMGGGQTDENIFGNSGNASRFFKSIIYTAKASKSERNMGLDDFEDKERVDYGGFHSEKGLIENNRNPENRLPTKNNHPTVKPIALMEYLINMVTREGQTVLDPFAGSGTTLIASKKLGRKYIGIELEPEYVKIAEARLISIKERLL